MKKYEKENLLFNGGAVPDNNSFYYVYYKNGKKLETNKEYKEKDGTWNFEAIFEDFNNEINTFKHTFKKAENGNYYWYSSEVVKEQ